MLLRAAAFYSDNRPGSGTAARGHQLLFAWLKQNGVETAALRMTDGSGLSRYNLLTPRARCSFWRLCNVCRAARLCGMRCLSPV
jgi:D-alanyl-D-alanine carboxypeptidase